MDTTVAHLVLIGVGHVKGPHKALVDHLDLLREARRLVINEKGPLLGVAKRPGHVARVDLFSWGANAVG